ncbi:MAG: hypothetical protein IJH04_08330 [Eggerthellaceae bacterium]|nr:hypothetical protein [Eggerthellaceae bacterium]
MKLNSITKTVVAGILASALVPAVAFAEDELSATSGPAAEEQAYVLTFSPKAIFEVFALSDKVDQSAELSSTDSAVSEAPTRKPASPKRKPAASVSSSGSATASKSVVSAASTSSESSVEPAASADEKSVAPATDKRLEYDEALIAEVGTQEETGHTICCPSFACAYGDVVIDGTVHDHDYYTCSCCTWNDWGEGGSFDRYVGSDTELLREAYDQITAGKPTVIHVTGTSAEHWITLIGYVDAVDPDNLTLDNFIALDPWDGVELRASERFTLYGDGCEHTSSRNVE